MVEQITTPGAPVDQTGAPVAAAELLLADLASFREATYHVASEALLYPTVGRVIAVTGIVAELHAGRAELASFASLHTWERLLETILQLGQGDRDALAATHVSLFAVGSPAVPCPPFESAYYDTESMSAGWVLSALEREYSTVGLRVAEQIGEPADHVAVELAYVALLCGREADAWNTGDAKRAREMLRRERSFLEHHLAVWLPSLLATLEQRATATVYPQLVELLDSFVQYDTQLVRALATLDHDQNGATG